MNPFLGLSQMDFTDAARLMDRVAHSGILMPADYYLELLRSGSITATDIEAAFARSGAGLPPANPVAWLEEKIRKEEASGKILNVADWMDREHATSWGAFITDEISKWASSCFDQGQSVWRMPWQQVPLYNAWKQAAAIDANPEFFGLKGFRMFVKQLPDSAGECIEALLDEMGVPASLAEDFVHRELMSVFGWSAWASYQDRQAGGQSVIRQLLAIRLAYDAALLRMNGGWHCQVTEAASAGFTRAKYIAQVARENSFRSDLAARLGSTAHGKPEATRPALQAVFCIDVRSEAYRRALEAQSEGIRTVGFAGFFGMALEFEATARCPVLIAPGIQVSPERQGPTTRHGIAPIAAAWKSLWSSATACFSSVEVGGIWFGARLARSFAGQSEAAKQEEPPRLSWQIPLASRIDLASGALRNMSLTPEALAPLVLFCGHGSRTENNPYGSALDCGACGGHKGDVNARFAAALMNDPEVRAGLAERGIRIPGDTVFVAGLHNTTTDEVTLFEIDGLSERQREELRGWLQGATEQARWLRNPDGEALRRSIDWSEVRPEWGLAGNAAFIAAPRSRTSSLDLKGRAFLHDYDSNADPDASVLTLILTAPVVVASWINLQYYGSVVNNGLLGSGNKTLHNVVGTFGVWEGNAGDLKTGLPLQSLHDGTKWVHEPLRLQVFVEASREKIDAVLQANPGVMALVENHWIHLAAMEGAETFEWRARGHWGLLRSHSL